MRLFTPLHDPPSFSDRLLGYGSEILVSMWTFLSGIMFILDPFVRPDLFSQTFGVFTPGVLIFVGVLALVGSIMVLYGVFAKKHAISQRWKVEKAGWWLIAATWLSYTVIVVSVYPLSFISWGLAFILVLTSIRRLVILHVIERNLRITKRRISTEEMALVSREE